VVSLDGVAPSWMVGVFASVDLTLHYKVQKFSSGTGSPRWSRKTRTVLRPFFRDHPGELVPEEGRLTEADAPTILQGATHPGKKAVKRLWCGGVVYH